MGADTKIGWADHTFNPWRGCAKIASGCQHCYAAELSRRNPAVLGRWGERGTRVVASESMWSQPPRWNAAARKTGVVATVFCASLADVFEDWGGALIDAKGKKLVGRDWDQQFVAGSTYDNLTLHDMRRRLFALIDHTRDLMWLLLTKRPENIPAMMPPYFPGGYIAEAGAMNREGPRPNLMLGTSVSTQADADRNIPALLKCRELAAGLFVSAEPLIENIDLDSVWDTYIRDAGWWPRNSQINDCPNCVAGENQNDNEYNCTLCDGTTQIPGIDWLIVGGESGRNRRTMPLDACRSLVDQCREAGVPCFVKQDSGHKEGQQGRLPDDLWAVKEFPEVIRS